MTWSSDPRGEKVVEEDSVPRPTEILIKRRIDISWEGDIRMGGVGVRSAPIIVISRQERRQGGGTYLDSTLALLIMSQ